MGDDLDDVVVGLLAVGLYYGQTQWSDPSHRIARLAHNIGTGPEPLFYLMGSRE